MTGADKTLPRVVLICHANDRIDSEGLAAWLALSFNLAGLVMLRDRTESTLQRIRREYKRVGLLRFLDVMLFRLYYRLRHARADAARLEEELIAVKSRYPADIGSVPYLNTVDPNSPEVRSFLRQLQPDIAVARCKFMLRPEVFNTPRFGTFVLHPGICPEYRNAHGCFWALAKRDLEHVGMTLLKVDEGVDTGPIYLQSSYSFDEMRESHIVIQYRVVLENLEAISRTLYDICDGSARPMVTVSRRSMTWGQPWLTAYLKWKRAARGVLA